VLQVAGTVANLPAAADTYKVVMYVSMDGGVTYWTKPIYGSSTTLSPAGAFTITGWASYPANDINFQNIRLLVVPLSQPVLDASGTAIPAAMEASAVVARSFPRGYAPGGGGTPPPAAAITMTAFPAANTAGAIAGTVAGLPAGQAFKVVLYLELPAGVTWIK
jgi:hypothetical protein